ncbi:MAG: GTP pyrophosphokinase family protein [Anaerovoracaceae bacterium]
MILEKRDDFRLDGESVPDNLRPLFADYRQFVILRNTYHAAIKEISTKLEILDDEFHVCYDYNPIHHMECRLKSPQSLFEKLERKGLDVSISAIENITDMAGVRVVCNYIDDVYAVAALLLKQDDIKLIRESDYIRAPKQSGYRSLHLVVEVPVFLSDRTQLVPTEVQFRTIAMDTWASLEHELKYKREGKMPESLQQELIDCANSMAEIDLTMEKIHKQL